LNVRVKLEGGGSHVAEIQVHQRDIERNAPDHKVYEYFRSLFVSSFTSTMGEWIALQARMSHLEGVMRVPVLMSLLIVHMDGSGSGAIPEVPETTPALYYTAMERLYRWRCGDDWERMRRLLRAVFTQNQLQRRRQFGHADVVSALQAAAAADGAPDTLSELLDLWNRAVEQGAAPFIKTLVKPAAARKAEGGDEGGGGAGGGGAGAHKATDKPPPLRLHPVQRGAAQLFTVADLCKACGVDAAVAGAFATGLGPGQKREASGDEAAMLRDRGVLAAAAAVTSKCRGPVTVTGEGDRTGARYVGQHGEAIGVYGVYLKVDFDDGKQDLFLPANLKLPVAGVLLLDGDAAAALLRYCGATAGVAEAFGAFLADAAGAGLYQATHLSLQESECAEAFRAAALLAPERRPRRAEGLFKWLGSATDAGAILNDGWYLGTLRLVRVPAAAEAQVALGRALFPFAPHYDTHDRWVEEDDGALHIGAGLVTRSLTATGAAALLSLVRTFGHVVEGLHLNSKFVDGPAGVAALGEALRAGRWPQLRTLNIRSNDAGAAGVAALIEPLLAGKCPHLQTLNIYGNRATKANLDDLSAVCPQLEVRTTSGPPS
jgi:hypothetical protein